ncbi:MULTISPECIES: helix-turn-helix transcriptional regulator [unclassified Nostoc]|uniref:helix-turn-helix transcriptional regulator n=1 Tax=unclassified Nostoc TaxID=2593658 RepID=UPI002AD3EB31|nr:helix-turn-helix transcriptional regulator [Nostoc sp. DedQUE03]MDZ7976432.1 helix-turn-helix transcriptional regulator [Nostoc sp. DedQUE03]MDZ8042757.1 helix-turn-helix transcriptional regulator [Nostoc sp. DedQUE02]
MDSPKSKLRRPRSNIATLRRQADLTQKALAEQIGVTVNTIANWENGRVDLWFIVVVGKLCEIFGCSPNDLIEHKDVDSERNALSLEEMRESLGTNEPQVTYVTDKQEQKDL